MTTRRANTATASRSPAHKGLSNVNFARLSAQLTARTGIKLTATKRLRIARGLRQRANALDIDDIDAYCRLFFEGGAPAGELEAIIHLATTNKTDFFRERLHFDILERVLLPALLGARAPGREARLKVWSAATSNGAEAYSVAMILAEALAKVTACGHCFSFAVLGTDISAEMIEAASRAIYPYPSIAPVPPPLRARYFMQTSTDTAPPMVRVVPQLRRRVCFRQLNLINKTYPIDRDVDVIFLRNVLIYFDQPIQLAVVRRLTGHLRSGGYLILGHTEAAIGSALGFKQLAAGVFRVT